VSTQTAATPDEFTLDTSQTARIPFSRLVAVEWRKMHDTRGGFWLLLITGALILLAMGLTLLVMGLEDISASAWDLTANVMIIPVSLLVPVFSVLIVTSEWGQRSALVTFALEPHRMRVLLAKLVTVSLLGLATIAVAVAVAMVTAAVGAAMTGNEMVWGFETRPFLVLVLQQVCYFLMGFGFGMFILSTPGAITTYYLVALLLPVMVYSILFFTFGWAQDLIPWIDMGYATTPIIVGTDPVGEPVDVAALDYLRFGFTAVLWVVIPLVAGFWRVLRAEVK
jgi:ABC-2 type transport system permease protein